MVRLPADRFGFPDFTGRTILVVDDHDDSLEFLFELLTFCGAEVLRAPSAAHARAHLHRRAPDLIVCDFRMPRETGVELMRWLRLHDDTSGNIPAIAVTAYPGDFLRQRDVAHAFDAHFEKPIDTPRFLGIAETLLLRPRPRDPARLAG
jgi:CheY-like chemotaxis protein